MSRKQMSPPRNLSLNVRKNQYLKVASSFVASFFMVYLLSASIVIALIFGFLLSIITLLISK